LDEADRILDMGFEKTVNAIIDFLPNTRQTLLFSATQTKSVKDLARLSLKNPEYVAVHEKSNSSTPAQLTQAYVVTELPDKLDILWSFIKSHIHQKSLIFLSSCKQVRFVYESFRKMQPGVPLLQLHGKLRQSARMEVYEAFSRARSAVLFATDIAARGLDFPAVNWVVQVDAPEDLATYIHRVGRTARYEEGGNALMFLLPSEEEGILELLNDKLPNLRRIRVNPSKTVNVQSQLQALCSQYTDLKYLAQKALLTYVKSIFLQKNKKVFDVHALPIELYAEAIGLPGCPKIKYLKRKPKEDQTSILDDIPVSKESKPKTKVERMMQRKNMDVLSEHYNKLVDRDSSESDEEQSEVAYDSDDDLKKPGVERLKDFEGLSEVSEDDENTIKGVERLRKAPLEDDFLTIKRSNHELEHVIDSIKIVPDASLSHKRMLREREKARKHLPAREKIVFDDEGNSISVYSLENEEQFKKNVGDIDQAALEYLKSTREDVRIADGDDKALQKSKLKEKKLAKKMKDKQRSSSNKGEAEAVLDIPVQLGDASEVSDTAEDSHVFEVAEAKPGKRLRLLEESISYEPSAKKLAFDEELALKLLCA
jgi:ATP-dependent RNA helicase DDX10/DBP4